MVKIPYVINFLGERERERELEGEREMREMRKNGAGSLVFIFLADLGTLEHKGLRSKVARFHILHFAGLRARWSAGARARAWLLDFFLF